MSNKLLKLATEFERLTREADDAWTFNPGDKEKDIDDMSFFDQVSRIAQALSMDVSLDEIRELLLAEGKSEEDIFLLVKSAQLYLRWFEE
jgi:hypothetical protein